MNWKTTLIKSLVYRVITITLGLLTAFIITGDFETALGLSLITESIQSLNYFGFESLWGYFYEKRIREDIKKEFRKREIDLKVSIEMIIDITKGFSEVDTFNPKIYNSLINFFDSSITNRNLKDFNSELIEAKKNFVALNQGRDF
ncbi:DUF2061 domain-containing protein [Promethearchaeum syntrophicum]|uniref:DUF2061 domain-containing protein n=1 Tax=Promethearchaeum syntrophicum TaxID=2594042 RepID=A0A5B9DBN6_9ARCH|nr:DUF2061 domain-containing protein [Candidatus Prometheoarchaeum syntrophicum]QEE16542.1 hypothetical protein DSAG12_02372 [Candidatus Prometheoarchaeum syntrophicum]